MMAIIAEALVIGYLPGAVFFRLPDRTSAQRAALSCDERLFWAVLLSGAWSLLVVLGLAAVGQYTFGRLLFVNVAIGLAGLFLDRQQIALNEDQRRGVGVHRRNGKELIATRRGLGVAVRVESQESAGIDRRHRLVHRHASR